MYGTVPILVDNLLERLEIHREGCNGNCPLCKGVGSLFKEDVQRLERTALLYEIGNEMGIPPEVIRGWVLNQSSRAEKELSDVDPRKMSKEDIKWGYWTAVYDVTLFKDGYFAESAKRLFVSMVEGYSVVKSIRYIDRGLQMGEPTLDLYVKINGDEGDVFNLRDEIHSMTGVKDCSIVKHALIEPVWTDGTPI